MNATTRTKMRRMLRELAARYRGDIIRLERDATTADIGIGIDDLTAMTGSQSATIAFMEHDRQTHAEILDALDRLNEGTYGACASCDTTISEARLEAIPYTRYCIDCAAAHGRRASA